MAVDLAVVGFKMRPNIRQVDEAIDLAQEVIARVMTLKAEAVEQRLLHHPPLAIIADLLRPGEGNLRSAPDQVEADFFKRDSGRSSPIR